MSVVSYYDACALQARINFLQIVIQGGYKGKINDSGISGEWSQQGGQSPLDLTKGEYEPEGLDFPVQAYEKIAGKWTGSVSGVRIAFRFEEAEDGQYIAVLDQPDQGITDVPVSSVEVEGDQVILKIAAAGVTFTATITGTELTGTWSQVGNELAVTLEKE